MAPHADRLTNIGREGFDLVGRFYGGGTWGQAPKKPYNVAQQYPPIPSVENVPRQYAPIPSEEIVPQQHASILHKENLIDSKTAAKKYKGIAFTQYYRKFVDQRF